MSRFTKFYPDAAALARNAENPSTYRADFLAWDSAAQGAICEEATHAGDLGQRLSATGAAIFARLAPGQRVTRDGIVYARD